MITVRNSSIAPDRYRCKMKWNRTYSNPFAVGFQNVQFRGNSVFDPEAALGGQSAMGYTNMIGLYNKWQVLGSKINIDILCTDTANSAVYALIPFNVPNVAFVDIDDVLGNPYHRHKMCGVRDGQNRARLTNYISTKKITGYKDVRQVDDLFGDASNNPVEQWFWALYAWNSGGALGSNLCFFTVTITYYVEWFDRQNLLQA